MRQRTKLVLNGNLLELVGAGCGVWGVDRLWGFSWALVLAAILLVAGAELVYGEHPDPGAPPGTPRVWKIPLPLKPEPRRWLKERRQAWGLRQAALKARASRARRRLARAHGTEIAASRETDAADPESRG
jgi:hypothetical protein